MKTLKSLLASIAFSLAGVAVHTNAASENLRGERGLCFQLTPVGTRRVAPPSPADGAGDGASSATS
ncbi:hypothetical protein [Pseudomonas sp. Q1-7]|uniref:hypothetical protein n=1 Tax=Pseudomonas sp. Q1-7 TaxID=3020843 RepID=UPI002300DE55|nr:hypothetical protein [Pseudomonas sp. Q1-7]